MHRHWLSGSWALIGQKCATLSFYHSIIWGILHWIIQFFSCCVILEGIIPIKFVLLRIKLLWIRATYNSYLLWFKIEFWSSDFKFGFSSWKCMRRISKSNLSISISNNITDCWAYFNIRMWFGFFNFILKIRIVKVFLKVGRLKKCLLVIYMKLTKRAD